MDAFGMDSPLPEGEEEGRGGEELGGEETLRRERTDLALESAPLSDGGVHRGEHLRKVAARLAVDLDGPDHPLEVVVVHPYGEAPHGFRQAATHADLSQHALD